MVCPYATANNLYFQCLPPLGCSHLQNENLQPALTCNLGTEKPIAAKELKVHMLNLKLKLTKCLILQLIYIQMILLYLLNIKVESSDLTLPMKPIKKLSTRLEWTFHVMKPTLKIEEKRDQRLRNKPLRGGNLQYIT